MDGLNGPESDDVMIGGVSQNVVTKTRDYVEHVNNVTDINLSETLDDNMDESDETAIDAYRRLSQM